MATISTKAMSCIQAGSEHTLLKTNGP